MKYYFIVVILFQFSTKSKSEAGETEADKLKTKAFHFYENDKYDEALPYCTFLVNLDSSAGHHSFPIA